MKTKRRDEAVPSKDYARQYRALLPELLPELERVLLNEEPILGESVGRFEEAFARHAGVRHAVGVNSGTDALWLALRALEVGRGDEVITAANAFVAAATAIRLCGAQPVLVDPDRDSLLLTAPAAARAITPRTKAIVPVHLYGRLCDMGPLLELARSRGLFVVEDAAQAHGAAMTLDRGGAAERRVRAGAFGHAGAFSFHPSKNLGAFGDGGLVTTDDDALAGRLRELRHLGKGDGHAALHVATNTKLDTLQAALLLVKLRRLDRDNERRRALASIYRRELAGLDELELPAPPADPEEHVFHLFVVRSARRDELRAFLAARSIRASIHYPVPIHRMAAFADLGDAGSAFEVAEESARTVLSLPIAPELTDDQIESVCAAVREFHGR
jgi:dTDP-4-amino-4,6-dideoxygalactose transaminase